MRCNRCHRPMKGTTAYDGACACGGLIEAEPLSFNLVQLRPAIASALRHAHERADRERQGMVVYLTHKPAMGKGDGVAVVALGASPPPESEEYQQVAPSPDGAYLSQLP